MFTAALLERAQNWKWSKSPQQVEEQTDCGKQVRWNVPRSKKQTTKELGHTTTEKNLKIIMLSGRNPFSLLKDFIYMQL